VCPDDFPAERAAKQFRDLHLEALVLAGVLRVGVDERRAAFLVRRPAQCLKLAFSRQRYPKEHE
jgi:hypothetical protein